MTKFRISPQEPLGHFQPNLEKHPWVKGTQVCSNEESCPFTTGDDCEIAKRQWRNLKIFSRTTRPLSYKLGTKHHWLRGTQDFTNKGSFSSQIGDFYFSDVNQWYGIIMSLCKCAYWLKLFLRWAMWPMGHWSCIF